MANKVTNYREVKYNLDTEVEALHWADFIDEVKCTWFDDGDYYAVYENLDEEDDHERRKYAVYAHSANKHTEELICLIADAGLVLDGCYDDEEYRDERNQLYRQIAILAGWPEKIELKKRYTVRIQRIMDVEVRADSREQACTIGRKLAFHANHVNTKLGVRIRNAMADCEFEFADAWDAPRDEDGVWDLVFDNIECTQILEED